MNLKDNVKGWLMLSKVRIKELFSKPKMNSFLPFLSTPDLLKWSEKITASKATIYDKAMDSEYLKSKIGGGNHRLFDGGHDLSGAWEKIKNASDTDTLTQEVIGGVQAIFKDASTVKGIPFDTIKKANYDNWKETISNINIPGLDSKYLYDLLSFDSFEVIGAGLGAIGAIFFLKKKDIDKLSEILGVMGITSIASANPLMAIIVIAVAGYNYKFNKQKVSKLKFFSGGTTAATSLAIFTVLGLPILIEFAIAVVVTKLIKKTLFEEKNLDKIRLAYENKIPSATNKLAA